MRFHIDPTDAAQYCAESWPRARVTALHTGATAVHFAQASEVLWPLWALMLLAGLWHYCRIIAHLPDVSERGIVFRYASATAFLITAIAVGVVMRFST